MLLAEGAPPEACDFLNWFATDLDEEDSTFTVLYHPDPDMVQRFLW